MTQAAPQLTTLTPKDAFDAWVILSARAYEVEKHLDNPDRASAREQNAEYAKRLHRIANALWHASKGGRS